MENRLQQLASMSSARAENDHSNAMLDHFGYWFPYEDDRAKANRLVTLPGNRMPDARINGKPCKR